MPWIITGALTDKQRALGDIRKPVHGPMPCKRWQADGKHRRVKGKRSNSLKRIARDKSEDARLAIQYAIWLAQRDNLILSGSGRVVFASVRTGNSTQSRPYAIHFNNCTIQLPNWDWVPADPIEENLALAA